MTRMFFSHLLGSAVAVILSSLTSVHADTVLGVYADINYWHPQSEVKFAQTSAAASSASQAFDLGSQPTSMFSLAVEHGIPLLPNLKAKHVSLTGDKTQDANLTLQSTTFTTNTTTHLDASVTELIAYYELLDNLVSVDVGIGAKIIDGDIRVADVSDTLTESVRETVPSLYAAAGGKLPFTGLSARAEISGLAYQDNAFIDAQAEVKYNVIENIAIDLGLKAGYRVISVKIDDVLDTQVTSSFQGPYLGLEAHF